METVALEESLKDLRARKDGAIEALIETYTQPLFAAALGLGFSLGDAEELVQETLTAFVSGVDRFEGRSQIKTYLFGIFYHKGSELKRRQAREEPVENIEEIFDRRFDPNGMWTSPPQGPEEAVMFQELVKLIRQCSETLSFHQRMAFYLKEVERESTPSICKILDVSVTHLGVLLFRARNKLRECLEKAWGKAC